MTETPRDELLRAHALSAAFEAQIGSPPEGVWAAPGRINLIGEHTDYNEGLALPLAIEQRALVAVRRRADEELRLSSAQAGREHLRLSELIPGRVRGWAAYVAGAAWAARAEGARATGFDLLLDSDVPIGAGLSSSAAVECATLVALAELWGLSRSVQELALIAQRAETEMAGVPCGLMDQLTSLSALAAHALYVDFRTLEVAPLPLRLERAGLGLLVIDTRSRHQLADGAYADRRRACQSAASALQLRSLRDASATLLEAAAAKLTGEEQRRARHVVSENARVTAAAGALRAAAEAGEQAPSALERLGPLLSASHASLRDDFEVSTPRLDTAAAAVERAGALGARMIGAGFGGCVLALVSRAEAARVAGAARAAYAAAGWPEPRCFGARASAGAGRLL